jgi:predicted DNA-binding transcriptional regulator AlpA
MQPRLIRLRDAPTYLGMDRNRFNSEVRPTLIEIPIGEQGVAFDRLDLDAWVDHYIQCNGRPAHRRNVWDTNECLDSPVVVASGTSTKKLTDSEFTKVLEQASFERRRNT